MNDAFPSPSTPPRRRLGRGVGWGLCVVAVSAALFGCWFWFRMIDPARDELSENAVASGENRLAR